jgi:glycine cleavage system H protein
MHLNPAPADRKYTKSHEWFKVSSNVVTIGITQFAADELTDITFVDLPKPGTQIAGGKDFGEIESVKATSGLYSAIGGEVIETNAALADEPGLVNSDPFEKGWMIKVKAPDLKPLDGLMDAAAYNAMLEQG